MRSKLIRVTLSPMTCVVIRERRDDVDTETQTKQREKKATWRCGQDWKDVGTVRESPGWRPAEPGDRPGTGARSQPGEDTHALTPWFWSPSLGSCEGINFSCFKPRSLGSFIMVVPVLIWSTSKSGFKKQCLSWTLNGSQQEGEEKKEFRV